MNAVRCLIPDPLYPVTPELCIATRGLQLVGPPYRGMACDAGARSSAAPVLVRDLRLHFSVSLDEEYVRLRVTAGAAGFDLGHREHHHVLLTLARLRLKDEAEGHRQSACGWAYALDVSREAGEPKCVNIDVFRIRQQFAQQGVRDFAEIIERRHGVGQLRIGTRNVTIVTI